MKTGWCFSIIIIVMLEIGKLFCTLRAKLQKKLFEAIIELKLFQTHTYIALNCYLTPNGTL